MGGGGGVAGIESKNLIDTEGDSVLRAGTMLMHLLLHLLYYKQQ